MGIPGSRVEDAAGLFLFFVVLRVVTHGAGQCAWMQRQVFLFLCVLWFEAVVGFVVGFV